MNMKKDWILTWMGNEVNPSDMSVEQIDVRDIARSLSMQCRYNGHVSKFYSVAEHSILISYALERDGFSTRLQKQGLLHDASEAYIGDIPTPLKLHFKNVKEIENVIHYLVSLKFNLGIFDDIIHEYDKRIIADERSALIPLAEKHWHWPYEPLGLLPIGFEPKAAEKIFLARYSELFDEDYEVLRPAGDGENENAYT